MPHARLVPHQLVLKLTSVLAQLDELQQCRDLRRDVNVKLDRLLHRVYCDNELQAWLEDMRARGYAPAKHFVQDK